MLNKQERRKCSIPIIPLFFPHHPYLDDSSFLFFATISGIENLGSIEKGKCFPTEEVFLSLAI